MIYKSGPGLRPFPRAYTPADSPIALPVEFTLAAFRFGHSMVRDAYAWNDRHRIVDLCKLIRMTNKQLPLDYKISWTRFFTNRAENIDTFITKALYDLPPRTVQIFRLQIAGVASDKTPFRDRVIPPLPELTLCRGSRVRLPSGECTKVRLHPTSR